MTAEHPLLAHVATRPVRVIRVRDLDEVEHRWSRVGHAPTGDAAIVVSHDLETAIAWAPDERYYGESLEALAHELGHLFGYRDPGEVLASEAEAVHWQIEMLRGLGLDLACPVNRQLLSKAASVASEFDLPDEQRAWVEMVSASCTPESRKRGGR